ncbi:MAG: hypothetical protein JO010_13690 [Alphaproteobacteria bacterium]|nr:hypothetical protein [Alphaproteobacteria bacterium]
MAAMSIAQAQRRTDDFLTRDMLEALRAVEYELPPFATQPSEIELPRAARSQVKLRHVRGAADATYLVSAFEDALLMQLQLNVWRLVAVYRVPARDALDAAGLEPRLARWQIGAQHAGWTIGWRDAVQPEAPAHRFVETYCYANAAPDFLENDMQKLFWRTDIVQMTRYFMLEARRCGVILAPDGLAAS